MAKKKKPQEKGQTSLFSYMEKTKEKKEPVKEPPKKEEPIAPPEEKVPEEVIEEKKPEKPEEPKKIKKIPANKFFKGDDTPFGLLEGDVNLEQIRRESFSSKYIRYLIKKGDIITDLERGLLLDVDYDGGENKAYCKFYDLDTDEIKIWIDSTNHEPYCYSRDSIAELETNIELTNYEGFVRFEEVKRYDLLKDKEISMTKIYGENPTSIGGSGSNIRNILESAWEADIRYHLNYIYDTRIIPGLVYSIKNNKVEKLDYKEGELNSEEIADELRALFKDESSEMREFAEKNLDIFLTPIPDIKRMALDIEVSMSVSDYKIPDPKLARQEVISVSFVATDGMKKVYVLEREGFSYGAPHKKFPSDGEVLFFKTEKELLTETFRLIWEYPVVITFNGDNFDFPYLFHRANKLKINKDLNPIQVKRGFGFLSRSECDLRRGIHIDIFSFFANRSISGYAFGGAYERNSLNAISSALLGREKYQHEEEIHDMTYSVLTWYNLKDSILTLELTKFNNSLAWNLLILLCRITKMPMHDMVRHQISAWIKNIIFFEHRRNNYLIPRRSEISEMKKGGYSKATIEGKGFQGAYVIPPVPGIHYEVVVMDFSSLYPSIIKEYNLSYETVNCPHDDCKENMVRGIPYYVCTHKMGIFAYIVGFFRDIRVKYFKPKSGDKSLTSERQSYNNTMQQALKVFINGCLPYDEEVIVKDEEGKIFKLKIGELENNWEKMEILSIERSQESFGSKKFVKIKGFRKRITNEYMEITLSDGRELRCTKNHLIPKIEESKNIQEVEAGNLKIRDEVLVCHSNPLNNDPPEILFIPDFIPLENLWVSLDRENYKKKSYRTNEFSSNKIIKVVNEKFKYSKVSKKYKCLWLELDPSEKKIIRQNSLDYDLIFLLKYGEESGKWFPVFLELPIEFFRLLGWYIAEGGTDKNRITITQSKKIHPLNYQHILALLQYLNYPYSHDNKKNLRINSNILKELIISLCSHGAANKKIPLTLLNKERATALIEDYFRGDGNLKKGKWKRYTTLSQQLKNDLLFIIGALGGYSSVVNPKNPNTVYRIIETEGRKYRRKSLGLVDYNGTTPVRIKNIKIVKKETQVFDIETGNGWFISTNGIIVHNSYGVFGSKNFPLFCLPVAESTTGIGQYSIKATIDKAEEMGVKVLYGDTDSVFLLSPSKDQLKKISDWSKKELDLDLEEEKTYQFLALSKRKKNYVGIYKDTQYIDIKGLVAKKSNTPNFIKSVFNQLTDILRTITNDDEFSKARNQIIEIIRNSQKKIGKPDIFTLEDYAINIGMQKKLESYDKGIPQHIRAVKEYIDYEKNSLPKNLSDREKNSAIKSIEQTYEKGSVVSFIKSKGPIGAKVIGLANLRDIDVKKYQELLKSALEQVLDALGISFDEIRGIKKMDAFF